MSHGFAAWWRRKAAAYAALWVWAGLGFALVPMIVQLHLADIFPGAPADRLLVGPFGWVHAHSGLRLQAQLWLGALFAWLLLGAIAVALEWLAWKLRADRDDHAWTSLAWALRSWPAWLVWTLGVALAACLGWPLLEMSDNGPVLALMLGILAFASVYFFAFNAEALRGDKPPLIWRPRWPGWPSVGSAIAYVLAIGAFDKGIDLFGDIVAPGQRWIPLSLGFASWVIALLWALVWHVAWLNRATLSAAPAMRRRALAAPVVSAAVVQELRYWLLGAMASVPILAATIANFFLIPSMVDSMGARGDELPAAWHALVVAWRFGSRWWWLAAVPLVWFVDVAAARLLVQLGTVDASGTTPPTRPDCDPAATAPPTA